MPKDSVSVWLRRFVKTCACWCLFAPYYYLCCIRRVEKGCVVLADGHQNCCPYAMKPVYEALRSRTDIRLVEYFHDYSFVSPLKSLKIMLAFIPLYARAEYVFICDCYLPTACFKKRTGTTLVQLWHSGGLMKKTGFDSPEDSAGLLKNQYRNTDVFTASSPKASDVLSDAFRIPRDKFSSAGILRMDYLYHKEHIEELRREFYKEYPAYAGRKIVLWAPTFRGNAHNGSLVGQEEILRLKRNWGRNMLLL